MAELAQTSRKDEKKQQELREEAVNYIQNVLKPLSKEEQKKLEAAKTNMHGFFEKKKEGLYNLFVAILDLDLFLTEEDYQNFIDGMPEKYYIISKNYKNQKIDIDNIFIILQSVETGTSGKIGHKNTFTLIRKMLSIQRAALSGLRK